MKNIYPGYICKDTIAGISRPIILCLIIFFTTAKIFPDSKINSATVIKAGNARFEFLTPSLVRIEYSPKDKFIDVPICSNSKERVARC